MRLALPSSALIVLSTTTTISATQTDTTTHQPISHIQNIHRWLSKASSHTSASNNQPRSLRTTSHRSLTDNSHKDLLQCLIATAKLDGIETLSNPYDAIQPDISHCDTSTSTCDFSDQKKSIEDNCHGRVITDDVLFCEEDMDEKMEGMTKGDVWMKNVPFCVASTCADGTTLNGLMRAAGDFLGSMPDFDMSDVPKAFRGEKCDSDKARLVSEK